MPDNIVKDSAGQVVVPTGTQKPLGAIPKDTLPHPVPVQMPAQQGPAVTQETVQSKAVSDTITFDELAVKKGFKTPDELAKAYANLETQNKRVEVTLADAIKARQEADPFAEPLPKADEVNTSEDAVKIVNSMISRQTKSLEDKMEFQFHLLAHPEDKEIASQALSYVKENPGIKWEVAFKAARADTLASTEREKGRQEAYQSIQNKAGAMGVNASQRAPEVGVSDIIKGIRQGQIPLSEARKIINNLSSE
jgi:hypothetical protein